MDRKASPDNHIRRVMDAALPGLEDDLFFEERVLHRIRTMNKRRTRAKRKYSRGLAVALALVLMTVTAVTVSLRPGQQQIQQHVAASAMGGEDEAPGFTDVRISNQTIGHTCVWKQQNTHQNVYRYAGVEQDMLCAQMIFVCGICGKTNGLSYTPLSEEPLIDHEWILRDYHIEGTTAHVFYKECTHCRTIWNRIVLACAGIRDVHIDPRYYDVWKEP